MILNLLLSTQYTVYNKNICFKKLTQKRVKCKQRNRIFFSGENGIQGVESPTRVQGKSLSNEGTCDSISFPTLFSTVQGLRRVQCQGRVRIRVCKERFQDSTIVFKGETTQFIQRPNNKTSQKITTKKQNCYFTSTNL